MYSGGPGYFTGAPIIALTDSSHDTNYTFQLSITEGANTHTEPVLFNIPRRFTYSPSADSETAVSIDDIFSFHMDYTQVMSYGRGSVDSADDFVSVATKDPSYCTSTASSTCVGINLEFLVVCEDGGVGDWGRRRYIFVLFIFVYVYICIFIFIDN